MKEGGSTSVSDTEIFLSSFIYDCVHFTKDRDILSWGEDRGVFLQFSTGKDPDEERGRREVLGDPRPFRGRRKFRPKIVEIISFGVSRPRSR